ncbi:helix-turn-helix domain-containing protein [Nocardioides sp.]|uniref:helix-turn-helix domain-containing protein n=1 Tax=Nocardioides sp. TaxID=35761 RepID=UPI00260553CE|nr:helix-turn-helix domain-containing protein [Nocardioides sp.]
MSQAWAEADEATVPAGVVQHLGDRVNQFADDITRRIQSEVTSYAGPAEGRRPRLIAMATGQAAALFLKRLAGGRVSSSGVDDLFRRMGYGEGIEGNTLDSLSAAVHLAGRQGWRHLQRAILEAGLSAATLAHAGEDLMAYVDHLVAQAATGHQMALRQRDRDVEHNRAELIRDLTEGHDLATITAHAEAAGWDLPAEVVVLVGISDDRAHLWPDTEATGPETLALIGKDSATYIVPLDHVEDVVAQCAADDVVLARCWKVDVEDTIHGIRWAKRTIDLVQAGVLPRTPVVTCSLFYSQLWLHGEPALRRHLSQELLRPLLAESPNSREILSETLLVWLETRESAPAIAAILGVHPQTVRYRWRRINELFGDLLRDPEYVGQLTMVLKSSLPLWLAGHKGDFERYWKVEAG